MARIRSVKPDFWDDEAIGEISRDARLLFIGLITQADDDGRLKGSPKLLKGKLLAYDDVTIQEVSGWLAELVESELIISYQVGGRPFIALPSWHKHQRISHKTDSALPSPSEADSADAPESFRKAPEDVYRDKEGIGEEGRGEERKASKPAHSYFSEWLRHFHETTGRTSVTGSKEARKSFVARIKEGKTVDDLKLATVGCHGDQFCRDNGYDVPETILRAGKVERYISLARDRSASTSSPGIDQAHQFAEMARQAEAEERAAA